MFFNQSKSHISIWRTSVFRISLILTVSFVFCVTLLLTSTYLRTTEYLKQQGDQIILGQANFLRTLPVETILHEIKMLSTSDLRGVNYYGVFDSEGTSLGGNVSHLPTQRGINGVPTNLTEDGIEYGSRVVVFSLPGGDFLLVGYNAHTLGGITYILLTNFISYGSLFCIAGIILGFIISRRPVKRIIDLSRTIDNIKTGNFSERFLVTPNRDELDAMCSLMNSMLEEIEHLLREMKYVSMNIAHDLRQPLASLSLMLYRMRKEWGEHNIDLNYDRLNVSIEYTSSLLNRFNALQRIAEIESKTRNSAMSKIDVSFLFDEVDSLFSAHSEENAMPLVFRSGGIETVFGDKSLIIEAIYNLIDNSFKYTKAPGHIILELREDAGRVSIVVEDTGNGIEELNPSGFVNTGKGSEKAQLKIRGTGLGLSIVSAVARMHGASVLMENLNPGFKVTLKGIFKTVK